MPLVFFIIERGKADPTQLEIVTRRHFINEEPLVILVGIIVALHQFAEILDRLVARKFTLFWGLRYVSLHEHAGNPSFAKTLRPVAFQPTIHSDPIPFDFIKPREGILDRRHFRPVVVEADCILIGLAEFTYANLPLPILTPHVKDMACDEIIAVIV